MEFEKIYEQVLLENALDEYNTKELCEKFKILCTELKAFNAVTNVTAIKEDRDIAALHFADSIAVARYIKEGARVIDVGCGGGFPTLPLAIVRPDLEIVALDSTAKKLKFVDLMANRLGLNVKTVSMRAEELANDEIFRESFDVCVSRAVARLNILDELCIPFVKVGGSFFALKGTSFKEEAHEAQTGALKLGAEPQNIYEFEIDGATRAILEYIKKEQTPKIYPRPFGKIKKRPL